MDITNHFSSSNPRKRIRLESDDWIDKAPRSCLLERWKEQDVYIDYLESRLNHLEHSIQSNEYLHEKELESKKFKSMLNAQFLTKTSQQPLLEQIRDIPPPSRLRQTYVDPSINQIFNQMRDEIDQCRKTRDEVQNELQNCPFTSDSKIGKMLTAKCERLREENDELTKTISSGPIAKLESEIVLQNQILSHMKDSQQDYEDILSNTDTNMDMMSNKFIQLRNQLNASHQQINLLKEENNRLKKFKSDDEKSISMNSTTQPSTKTNSSHENGIDSQS